MDPPSFFAETRISEDPVRNVQPKGHEIIEGDEKLPSARKQKRSGLGENCGQGVGYGGYSVEQIRRKARPAQPIAKEGDGC
jgi:hypothetical protein